MRQARTAYTSLFTLTVKVISWPTSNIGEKYRKKISEKIQQKTEFLPTMMETDPDDHEVRDPSEEEEVQSSSGSSRASRMAAVKKQIKSRICESRRRRKMGKKPKTFSVKVATIKNNRK